MKENFKTKENRVSEEYREFFEEKLNAIENLFDEEELEELFLDPREEEAFWRNLKERVEEDDLLADKLFWGLGGVVVINSAFFKDKTKEESKKADKTMDDFFRLSQYFYKEDPPIAPRAIIILNLIEFLKSSGIPDDYLTAENLLKLSYRRIRKEFLKIEWGGALERVFKDEPDKINKIESWLNNWSSREDLFKTKH